MAKGSKGLGPWALHRVDASAKGRTYTRLPNLPAISRDPMLQAPPNGPQARQPKNRPHAVLSRNAPALAPRNPTCPLAAAGRHQPSRRSQQAETPPTRRHCSAAAVPRDLDMPLSRLGALKDTCPCGLCFKRVPIPRDADPSPIPQPTTLDHFTASPCSTSDPDRARTLISTHHIDYPDKNSTLYVKASIHKLCRPAP